MKFDSFWDFIRYIEDNRFCTNLSCTTCGCMPYKKLCREIGYKEMYRMISEVTGEEISGVYAGLWYEPLRIIYDYVFTDIPADNALMEEYLKIRERLLAEKELRRINAEIRMEQEQKAAQKRRMEREILCEEHRERSRIRHEQYLRGELDIPAPKRKKKRKTEMLNSF